MAHFLLVYISSNICFVLGSIVVCHGNFTLCFFFLFFLQNTNWITEATNCISTFPKNTNEKGILKGYYHKELVLLRARVGNTTRQAQWRKLKLILSFSNLSVGQYHQNQENPSRCRMHAQHMEQRHVPFE